ncbi:hypothetical protein DL96DRAFT_1581598 [Flagelloscypha sp. PMI_526]|nr:hypothetical protein DL96DRAFT_1581598 [Flagelloscypha sp. PMI_526]
MHRIPHFTFWDLHQWQIGVSFLFAIVLYEHLITLDREVQYFWRRGQFSLGVVLFFVNRYFIWVPVALQLAIVSGRISVEHCAPIFRAITFCNFIATWISGTILTLRTIALWNNSRKVRIFFWILVPATAIPSVIVATRTRTSLKFVPLFNGHGCKLGRSENNLYFTYIMVTVYNMGIFILTLLRSLQHLRQKHSRWVTVIYAQGLGFNAVIFVFTMANMLMWTVAPVQYQGWLSVIQVAVSSICCSRVVFSLFDHKNVEKSTSLTPTDEMHVWTTVIENQAAEPSYWDDFENRYR